MVDEFALQSYNRDTGSIRTIWTSLGFDTTKWTQARVPLTGTGGKYQMQFFVKTTTDPISIAIDDVSFYKKSCQNCRLQRLFLAHNYVKV